MRGVDFLNKLYRDIYKDGNNNIIDKIERVNNKVITHDRVSLLKRLYYDKYVIKSSDINNNLDKESIINAQKESLDKWIDYLTRSNHPTWAKYWAFRGMLKIGNYDYTKDTYLKRSKKTTSPFITLNPEVLSRCMDLIINYIDKDKLTDTDLDKLVEHGNFSKLYTLLLKDAKKTINSNSSLNDGKWIKYNYQDENTAKKSSNPEYLKLYNSLQGYNTGWCTAGSKYMAFDQICGVSVYPGGDFYVYYTKDASNNYKIPRIAIRMSGNKIGEIRGVDSNQNIEDGCVNIIISKLKELNLDDKDINKQMKTLRDSKRLSTLVKKNDYNLDDLKFIYEVNDKISSFGWADDPRISDILSKRNMKKDINKFNRADLYNMISNNPSRIKYIDNTRLEEDMCLNAVSKDGYTIKYIDSSKLTNLICYTAVKRYPYAIEFIPDKFKTKEICELSVLEDPMNLKYIPKDKMSNNILLEAVSNNGLCIKYIDKSLLNKEIIDEAIKNNSYVKYLIGGEYEGSRIFK